MVLENKTNQLIEEAEIHTFEKNCRKIGDQNFASASSNMRAWIAECEDFIKSNYGIDSSPWKIYKDFDINILTTCYGAFKFNRQKQIIISALTACLRITPNTIKPNSSIFNKTKVFIVHGHDEEVKHKVARFIEKLGFESIILHEKASSSATIIEKIEENTDVGFGIVLYTPCDVGNVKETPTKLNYRARQNVVFEHGFLIGKIGRKNVCALVKDDIEKPNDISGIVYITMDDNDAWQIQLARELNNSGYEVDMNKLIK